MTLDTINSKFTYVTDKEMWGVDEYWCGLMESDGELWGDCEDYAITLKNNIIQFKEWKYYWCKMNGQGHCILVNPQETLMIDNNTKEITFINDFERVYTITELRPYTKLELLWKFTQAKVLSVWFKIKG
jgi:predicted transglutaminase-like cysteine proteinase